MQGSARGTPGNWRSYLNLSKNVSDYPDSDWPYPFFFNGEELSPWSAQWHLCSIGDYLNDFVDDPESGWDEFIGFKHIWHLQCRIDHIGSIDSEDATIFHVCVQEVLRVILLNRPKVIESISSRDTGDLTADEVFLQIVEGVAKMIELCIRDGCAFWTSGYDEDRERVLDWIRRSRLPRENPEFVESPHERQRTSEQLLRAGFQLSELRSLAQNGTLDKRLRQTVNQLPKLTERVVADQRAAHLESKKS